MEYAIVAIKGQQEIVEPGKTVWVDLLPDKPGTAIDLKPVLLVRKGDKVLAGKQAGSAVVKAEVVGAVKGPKLEVFRYRRKKGIRKKTGHRQPYTELKIKEIVI